MPTFCFSAYWHKSLEQRLGDQPTAQFVDSLGQPHPLLATPQPGSTYYELRVHSQDWQNAKLIAGYAQPGLLATIETSVNTAKASRHGSIGDIKLFKHGSEHAILLSARKMAADLEYVVEVEEASADNSPIQHGIGEEPVPTPSGKSVRQRFGDLGGDHH